MNANGCRPIKSKYSIGWGFHTLPLGHKLASLTHLPVINCSENSLHQYSRSVDMRNPYPNHPKLLKFISCPNDCFLRPKTFLIRFPHCAIVMLRQYLCSNACSFRSSVCGGHKSEPHSSVVEHLMWCAKTTKFMFSPTPMFKNKVQLGNNPALQRNFILRRYKALPGNICCSEFREAIAAYRGSHSVAEQHPNIPNHIIYYLCRCQPNSSQTRIKQSLLLSQLQISRALDNRWKIMTAHFRDNTYWTYSGLHANIYRLSCKSEQSAIHISLWESTLFPRSIP